MKIFFIACELFFLGVIIFQFYQIKKTREMMVDRVSDFIVTKGLMNLSRSTADELCDWLDGVKDKNIDINSNDFEKFQTQKVRLFQIADSDINDIYGKEKEIVEMITDVYENIKKYDVSFEIGSQKTT